MRLLWNVIKKVAYAIDDAICWFFSFGSAKRKARDRLSLNMQIELFRFRNIFRR
jgi:hypothetical protein